MTAVTQYASVNDFFCIFKHLHEWCCGCFLSISFKRYFDRFTFESILLFHRSRALLSDLPSQEKFVQFLFLKFHS